MFRLNGKTAIVSGASQGIGQGIAQVLAEAGAHVFLCDIKDEAGEQAAATLRENGFAATYQRADVTRPQDTAAVASAALSQTGRVDIVVNNASCTTGEQHRFDEATDAEWQMNIEIGLLGTRNLTVACLPAMMKQQSGSIIVISSAQGLVGCPASGPYSVIKTAQVGFVRSAAYDYAKHNIRVNAICPGPITVWYSPKEGSPGYDFQIQSTLLGRRGEPRDIGYAALYLASDEANYVTGAVLPVDGGWTAK
jgi:NAD(P)-dependent dehydrogenase (short-subunit alcohol dehydrogenase family)